MGFERQVKKYTLVWGPDDGDMAGFECTVKGVSLGRYLELVKLRESEALDATMELIEALAGSLTAWNLEDDGVPIPVSHDAVLAEDSDFVMKIFLRWLEAIGSVEAPLPPSSNGSPLSLEALTPTVLSPASPSS